MNRITSLTVAIVLVAGLAASASAAVETWIGASGGSWGLGANWSGGAAPQSGDTVTLGLLTQNPPSTPISVLLGGNQTINTLYMLSPESFTIDSAVGVDTLTVTTMWYGGITNSSNLYMQGLLYNTVSTFNANLAITSGGTVNIGGGEVDFNGYVGGATSSSISGTINLGNYNLDAVGAIEGAATIGGTGTINANIATVSGGWTWAGDNISPGGYNSLGTLTINGSVTTTSYAPLNLMMNLGNSSTGACDKVNFNGSFSLNASYGINIYVPAVMTGFYVAPGGNVNYTIVGGSSSGLSQIALGGTAGTGPGVSP